MAFSGFLSLSNLEDWTFSIPIFGFHALFFLPHKPILPTYSWFIVAGIFASQAESFFCVRWIGRLISYLSAEVFGETF